MRASEIERELRRNAVREDEGGGLRHLADKVEKVIKLYPTVAINYRLPLTRPEFQNSSLSACTPPHCLKFEAAKCKYLDDDTATAALLRERLSF